MRKALIVATVHGFVSHFEQSNIRILQELNYKISVACNLDGYNGELDDLNVELINIPFSRSPYRFSNIKAYRLLKKNMINERYDLVHCHTPVGGAIARLAAKSTKIRKIIYTAHGFHFYKGAPIKNWLLYFPLEKFLARYTDILITINKEDYFRATKSLKPQKIRYVAGVGIDIKRFCVDTFTRGIKRAELGISEESIVLLSVGELSRRKNHETVIKALAILRDLDIVYIICGIGSLKDYLYDLVDKLNINNKVLFLGYRKDIPDLCNASDIFVFPSYQEGLPVALMEAMAGRLPIVCSNIRGNIDLIDDNMGGFIIGPSSVDEYADKIRLLSGDKELRRKMGDYNINKISKYDIKNIMADMKKIYCEI